MKKIEKLLIEEFKNNNVNFDNDFRYDYVDDSFTDVLKSVIVVVKKLTIPVVMCSLRSVAINYAKEKYGSKYNLSEYHIEIKNCINDYEKGLQKGFNLKDSSNNC
jgi:hypothetical protein